MRGLAPRPPRDIGSTAPSIPKPCSAWCPAYASEVEIDAEIVVDGVDEDGERLVRMTSASEVDVDAAIEVDGAYDVGGGGGQCPAFLRSRCRR
eukprot:9478077-Pyramimonas_sp.AAC.1